MNGRTLGFLIAAISAALFIFACMFIGGIVFAKTAVISTTPATPSNCTATYAAGTEVTLTATPCPGDYFVRWEGACAGQGPICKVKMDGNKETTAVFEPIPFPQNLRLLDFRGFTADDFMRCQNL